MRSGATRRVHGCHGNTSRARTQQFSFSRSRKRKKKKNNRIIKRTPWLGFRKHFFYSKWCARRIQHIQTMALVSSTQFSFFSQFLSVSLSLSLFLVSPPPPHSKVKRRRHIHEPPTNKNRCLFPPTSSSTVCVCVCVAAVATTTWKYQVVDSMSINIVASNSTSASFLHCNVGENHKCHHRHRCLLFENEWSEIY